MKKIVILLLLLCGVAAAQSTGGHMGGGDWGGGGGGGGGSWGGGGSYSSGHSSSWSSHSGWGSTSSSDHDSFWGGSHKSSSYDWDKPSHSWDHDYSSSHYDYSSSPGPDVDLGTFFFVIGIIATAGILIAIFWSAIRRESFPTYLQPDPDPVVFNPRVALGIETPDLPSISGIDVTVLRVAVDGRARKFIQTELAQIADTCDTATAKGRALMLSQVTLLLRRVKDAWVYGGAHNEPISQQQQARKIYQRHVDDARTRFDQETISNVQGQRSRQAATDIARRSDEGEGLILVTIVIAARAELYTVYQIGDGEDLRKALESASYLEADQLVAVDVVWMPSEENDRMSSIELEAKYPRPEMFPIRGALVGKTFCAYCAGPFPAELTSCPHCGAPTASRAA